MTRRLPVVGTSAASTAFCAEAVPGPDYPDDPEDVLYLDGNGKITWRNGTLEAPRPNAFSLVQIEDCPGSTPSCRASCYVHGLEKHAPDTHALYRDNSVRIRRILADAEHADTWADTLGTWIASHAAGGFRWHVSGDVFALDYAQWILAVCRASANVRHWIYTRSFWAVSTLTIAPNLTVNVSADRDNWREAAACRDANPGTRVCYMTTGDGWIPDRLLRYGDVVFPDYGLRDGTEQGRAWFAALAPWEKQLVCPVDYVGKAEERRCGPCPRCLYPAAVSP